MSSSSSDSDVGERVKNVSSFMVKSKIDKNEAGGSYAYKRCLGDLIFDSNFEGGNLGFVEQIDRYEYDLMVRPDVANPRHRVWFNFTVSNQRLGQCIIFTFVNFSETIRMFHEGLTPVVRSQKKPNWTRLHEDQAFYYKSAQHGSRYVLSIAFRFSSYDDKHQFALFYPYTYSTLISFLNRWSVEIRRSASCTNRLKSPQHHEQVQNTPDSHRGNSLSTSYTRPETSLGFHRVCVDRDRESRLKFLVSKLANSVLSRSILQITIGQIDTSYGQNIIIICRASNGNLNSAASLVCQGYLDFMLSKHLVANELRNCAESFIFPMVDPDSVCSGNSRTDIFGQMSTSTLSKRSTSRTIYTNIRILRQVIEDICTRSKRTTLVEIHVNLNLIGSRIVGTLFDESVRMEKHLNVPRLMSKFAQGFHLENCEFLKSRDTWIDVDKYPYVDQYRLEVSPYAFYKRSISERSYSQYDQMQYMLLGKALAHSLLDMSKIKRKDVIGELLAFHLTARDIDDLILNSQNIHSAT